jgi:hypothetical protein
MLGYSFSYGTVLSAQPSPGEQIHHDEYQHDHQEQVNESSAEVEQEPDQPKEEQYDDDRPKNAYHFSSNVRLGKEHWS